ncbi:MULTISPECIES: hypothetical protein [Xanthomonas]|uniref:hypothetical protein n=2 Tax=Xanthomonas TaxID=338 RepID=UPI00052E3A87|nr:hypothetical protein H8Z74_23650 [Xanthomonas citri pv. citri]CEE18610.1 conserved hypothetical protein [Xanthomonas citri pv. citri]CEE50796.1 conserved hypothetical protein [Xanthomonas citri pv. citri]CEE58221.1 conserved hypothetical protein [Xanthomonas citri pv. citri]CEH60738.1 conserved hypothetical protein [Xanthomonas citri pv. citri]
MSRARRSFPPELLARLRDMPVPEALDLLGVYWKRDPDFWPLKDKTTIRVNVSIGGGGVELLATGPKWFNTRAEKGGGGAIDLAMHLFRLDFVSAVKRLEGLQ